MANPTPVSTKSLSPAGQQYRYVPNGTGGVNYFRGNVPVTNKEYAMATGQDTNAIEANVWNTSNQKLFNAFPSESQQSIDAATQANAAKAKAVLDAAAAGTLPGGSSGSSAAVQPSYALYNNRKYDLSDPNQASAYYNAVKDTLGQQRDAAVQAAQEAYRNSDAQTVSQYQGYISTLDQNLADVDAAAKTWANDYLKTTRDFNQNKSLGDTNRGSYFAQLSPNAFQSSQSSSQGFANDQYAQGLSDLANQAQSTVGLGYLNAYDPNNASQGSLVGSLDASSQYGRNVGDIGTQRKNLEDSFNAYRNQARSQLQANLTTIGQNYQDSVNSNAQSLGQTALQNGYDPFQFQGASVTPYKASTPDISQYTPYTSFSSLSSNQPGTTGAYKKPVTPNNAYSQPALDQWLGRTGTQLPADQKNAWFSKYMLGKAGI